MAKTIEEEQSKYYTLINQKSQIRKELQLLQSEQQRGMQASAK